MSATPFQTGLLQLDCLYSVAGKQHKIQFPVESVGPITTLPIYIKSRDADKYANQLVGACASLLIGQVSWVLPASVSYDGWVLQQWDGARFNFVDAGNYGDFTSHANGTAQLASQFTLTARGYVSNTLSRLVVLDSNLSAPFKTRSPLGDTGNAGKVALSWAGADEDAGPLKWFVRTRDGYFSAKALKTATVSLNKKLRRTRGL